MTERERRPEAGHEGEPMAVGFMTSAAGAFETSNRPSERKPMPEGSQPPGDDAEFERQMALGRASMRKHRAVLAALAK